MDALMVKITQDSCVEQDNRKIIKWGSSISSNEHLSTSEIMLVFIVVTDTLFVQYLLDYVARHTWPCSKCVQIFISTTGRLQSVKRSHIWLYSGIYSIYYPDPPEVCYHRYHFELSKTHTAFIVIRYITYSFIFRGG